MKKALSLIAFAAFLLVFTGCSGNRVKSLDPYYAAKNMEKSAQKVLNQDGQEALGNDINASMDSAKASAKAAGNDYETRAKALSGMLDSTASRPSKGTRPSIKISMRDQYKKKALETIGK